MIILIIILFFIILLALGIRIAIKYDKKGDTLKGNIKILILRSIKIYAATYPGEEEKESGRKEKKDRDMKKIYELAKPCFDDLIEFIRSFFNSINIHKLENHMIIGFDSYADTGKYIGIIWGVLAMINTFDKNARLSAEPSFAGSVLDSHGDIDIDIMVLKLIVPAIRNEKKKEIRTLIRGVVDG